MLILASAVFLVAFLHDWRSYGGVTINGWGGFEIVSGVILNLVYLVFGARRRPASGASRPPGRFSRLVGLWLDAKEAELRKRAGK